MKDAYIAMWHTNGNVALIWHAIMAAAVIFITCRVWIARREKWHFNLRTRQDQRTYPENTDHHDY